MAYKGITVPIPIGQGGLETDNSPSDIQPTNFIEANNITVESNIAEKVGGSVRLNASQISGGVMGAFDWWPTTSAANRRLIIVGGNGKVYSMETDGTVAEVPVKAGDPAPATLSNVTNQVYFVTGGAESGSRAKKLFIFTGSNEVQVISGTTIERFNLTKPGWGTNYPSWGILHKNRLFCGSGFRVYASDTGDHEDFTTAPALSWAVYPGEGEKLIGSTLFKSRLFVFKYPTGVYYLVDSDATATNWYFTKSSEEFGFASPHSVVAVLNDVLIKNSSGSISSVAAVQEFGDIAAGDVLSILKIEKRIRDITNPAGTTDSHGIYYSAKKLVMFTYRSTNGSKNDMILMFHVGTSGKAPRATIITKDAPNCLALYKDSTLVERPIYGSLDGYIYLMDQISQSVNGAAYTGEFQTPHMDFGFVSVKNGSLAGKQKHFDFLELRAEPLGDWPVYADIIIDGNVYETVRFDLSSDDLLADDTPDSKDFILAENDSDLDASFLAGEDLVSIRKQIHGTGRTLSVRIYNSGYNEGFRIAKMLVAFRPGGEAQRSS